MHKVACLWKNSKCRNGAIFVCLPGRHDGNGNSRVDTESIFYLKSTFCQASVATYIIRTTKEILASSLLWNLSSNFIHKVIKTMRPKIWLSFVSRRIQKPIEPQTDTAFHTPFPQQTEMTHSDDLSRDHSHDPSCNPSHDPSWDPSHDPSWDHWHDP